MFNNYKYYLKETYDFDKGTWFCIGLALWTIGGVLGFLYETFFYWMNSGQKAIFWRSSGFGPWNDVYCVAALLLFLILYKLRRQPWFVILIGGLGCTLVKFLAGYGLFQFYNGTRIWNYNLEIWNDYNIGGFVCLRTCIEFAALAVLMIYVIGPLVFHMACEMRRGNFVTLWLIIGLICVFDILYNDVACVFAPQLLSAESIYRGFGIKYLSY